MRFISANDKSRRSNYAFTLLELMVVIAVIGILAALLLPTFHATKNKVRRMECANNLRQINLGVQMYCDEFNGNTPVDKEVQFKATNFYQYDLNSFFSYRRLIRDQLGMKGEPSPGERLFACPADTFYYHLEWPSLEIDTVPASLYDQTNSCYSSYAFNGGITNLFNVFSNNIGIGSQKISSIKNPVKTVLVTETSAFYPFSWHEPGTAASFGAVTFGNGAVIFTDAKNMLSFADGHVSYIKIFWNISPIQPGVWPLAIQYNPPEEYDYQWTGD